MTSGITSYKGTDQIVFNDGTRESRLIEDANVVDSYRTMIDRLSLYQYPKDLQVVRRLAFAPCFRRDSTIRGYCVQLNPEARICTDILTPDEFVGIVAAAKVHLDSDVDARWVEENLQWACPRRDPELDNRYAGMRVVIGGRDDDAERQLWKNCTKSACVGSIAKDLEPWEACLDDKGFAGLYRKKGDLTKGLVVIRCGQIPAQRQAYDLLRDGDHPNGKEFATYGDIVGCESYTAIIGLAERNARRLLHRACAALRSHVMQFEDYGSVPIPKDWKAANDRDRIIRDSQMIPRVAVADYVNQFNLFVPTDEGRSVGYFDVVSPTGFGDFKGGFLAAGGRDGEILACEGGAEARAFQYFDGACPGERFAGRLPNERYERVAGVRGSAVRDK